RSGTSMFDVGRSMFDVRASTKRKGVRSRFGSVPAGAGTFRRRLLTPSSSHVPGDSDARADKHRGEAEGQILCLHVLRKPDIPRRLHALGNGQWVLHGACVEIHEEV